MKTIRKILLMFIVILPFVFMGCQKDIPNDKLVSVNVKTEGILINKMKSWDPSTWVYTYNPNPYNLVMTSTTGGPTYTYSKTISQLNTGFDIMVVPGTYNVSYLSNHIPFYSDGKLSDKLDLSISQTITISSNGSITLIGHNEDYLIVMDITNSDMSWLGDHTYPSTGWEVFLPTGGGENPVRYGYMNIEGNTIVSWTLSTSTIYIGTIPNTIKNNIYHIIKGLGGKMGISIVPMVYNTIIV